MQIEQQHLGQAWADDADTSSEFDITDPSDDFIAVMDALESLDRLALLVQERCVYPDNTERDPRLPREPRAEAQRQAQIRIKQREVHLMFGSLLSLGGEGNRVFLLLVLVNVVRR